MTTVVNNPAPSSDSTGGMGGMVVGLVALAVVAYLFVMYGVPAISKMGSPQINIPGKIDVNVQQTK